jgi:hypothetical protein
MFWDNRSFRPSALFIIITTAAQRMRRSHKSDLHLELLSTGEGIHHSGFLQRRTPSLRWQAPTPPVHRISFFLRGRIRDSIGQRPSQIQLHLHLHLHLHHHRDFKSIIFNNNTQSDQPRAITAHTPNTLGHLKFFAVAAKSKNHFILHSTVT